MTDKLGFEMTPARREAIDRIARSATPIKVKPLSGPGPWPTAQLAADDGRGWPRRLHLLRWWR